MARDHNDAEYELAMQASRDYRDTRTRDQRVWDAHASAANELIGKIRLMTCRAWLGEPQDPYGFHANAGEPAPRAPNYLEHVAGLVSDLERELRALRIMGFREGSPAPSMPTLKPITTRVAGQPANVVSINPAGEAQ